MSSLDARVTFLSNLFSKKGLGISQVSRRVGDGGERVVSEASIKPKAAV